MKAERLDLARKGRRCHIVHVEGVKWQHKAKCGRFCVSISGISRAENVKLPSSVIFEYCYYKLIIQFSNSMKAFSLKKKGRGGSFTRRLACSIKHGKFLF